MRFEGHFLFILIWQGMQDLLLVCGDRRGQLAFSADVGECAGVFAPCSSGSSADLVRGQAGGLVRVAYE